MTVRLEQWGEDDLWLLEALMGDPEMTEHLGGPESPEKLRERQARYLRTGSMFKIVDEETGEAVGSVGFWEKDWQGEQIYETGWMVLKAHQAAASRPRRRRSSSRRRRRTAGDATCTRSRRPQTARRTRSAASSASRFSARSSSSFRPGTSRPQTTGASI